MTTKLDLNEFKWPQTVILNDLEATAVFEDERSAQNFSGMINQVFKIAVACINLFFPEIPPICNLKPIQTNGQNAYEFVRANWDAKKPREPKFSMKASSDAKGIKDEYQKVQLDPLPFQKRIPRKHKCSVL